MKCKAVGSLLSEYVSQELSHQRSGAVKKHLENCSGCRRRLASLERAIHDLQSPVTVFDAPDVLSAVKERVQHRRKPLFRPAAVWGLAGAAALALMICWSSVRSPEPAAVDRSPVVTAEAQEKNHSESPKPEVSVAEAAPDSSAPPHRVKQLRRQARHQPSVSTGQDGQIHQVSTDTDPAPEAVRVEPEQPEVAFTAAVSIHDPRPAPGEWKYECVDGHGLVYRDYSPIPGSSLHARMDVMVVPGNIEPNCRPLIEQAPPARLASAEYIIRRREGAM